MNAGEVVDLEPGQVAAYADGMARRFVSHNAQPLAEILEELRALVAGREALKRSTYSDHCVARVLDHVEQLHATIRGLSEVIGRDPAGFGPQVVRLVYRQLATFEPPKA